MLASPHVKTGGVSPSASSSVDASHLLDRSDRPCSPPSFEDHDGGSKHQKLSFVAPLARPDTMLRRSPCGQRC